MKTFKPAVIGAAVIALLSLGVSSAGARNASQGAKRQCFRADMVSNFREGDGTYVNLRVGVREVYRLEFRGKCPNIGDRPDLGLKTRTGSDLICGPMDVDIVTPTSIGPQTCSVASIRKLSADEIAALPASTRP